MTLLTLFEQVNSAYRGSDDNAPTTGEDYDLWLMTANRKQSEWARDGKNTWKSLFEIRTLGNVSASSQTYDLDDEILLPSDNVQLITSSQTIDYAITTPQERNQSSNAVYLHGSDPQKLTFATKITSTSPIVGASISLAGYYLPTDLVSANDTVQVDDPYWLVYAVAAELAFNDLTYESKSDSLNVKANALYSQMVMNNRRGSYNNPRTAKTNMNRILDPRSESGY